MGGTTAKASLVEGGRPHFTAEFEVAAGLSASSRLSSGGGYALSVPFIDLAEIGAGGGSLIWIDPAGAPKVGPSSAGAVPGPVCYGKGGEPPDRHRREPAARLPQPGGLLDGTMPLFVERARAVFQREVADRLGLGPARRGVRLPRAGQREHDPGDQVGVRPARPRPARLHARRLRRAAARSMPPRSPASWGSGASSSRRGPASSRPSACSRPGSSATPRRRTCGGRASSEPASSPASSPALEADARDGRRRRRACATARSRSRRGRRCATSARASSCRSPLPPRGGSWSAWLARLEDAFAAEHERTYGHRTDNPTEVVHLRVVAREAEPPPFPDGARSIPARGPTDRERGRRTSASGSGCSRRRCCVAAT